MRGTYTQYDLHFADEILHMADLGFKELSMEPVVAPMSAPYALHEEDAGEYQFPMEMLRLAPSAVNKQPWRIVVDGDRVHFFEKPIAGSGKIDMQRIDVGIGICHFHLAAEEQGLRGHFERTVPDFTVPADLVYIASWVRD